MFDHFQKLGLSVELSALLEELMVAIQEISYSIVHTDEGKAGSHNVFGEEQARMDLRAEAIMDATVKTSPYIKSYCSEEIDACQQVNPEGKFHVFYDPLDGSSLLDVNFAVGTIVGVFEGQEVIGRTCREQVAALFAVYGPRTTVMMATEHGVMEWILVDRVWTLQQADVKLQGGKAYFAPGNLRAGKEREDYAELVRDYMDKQYTLRYTGGMVPDINHILKKGGGVFLYPGMPSKPKGKLRLLYECGPMAYIMEKAGGASSDGERSILDVEIESYTQTTPIFIGEKAEVEKVVEWLK